MGAPTSPTSSTTPRLGGVLLTAARCGLRRRHDWRHVAVSAPLPAQGLPAQHRRICRDCGAGRWAAASRATPAG